MSEKNSLQTSPRLTEIMTTVPRWIFRWGITIVFFLLFGLIIFSGTISYPDIVRTNIKVNSLNSPKSVLAHHSGKLTSLFVKDGETVKEGEIMGFIESIGDPRDVIELSKFLSRLKLNFEKGNLTTYSKIPTSLNLGEMQESYQNFFKEYLDFQSALTNGYKSKNIEYIRKDLGTLIALKSRLEGQKELQAKELKNSEEELRAYKQLYTNKVISRSEYMLQENKFLTSMYPNEQTEISILNNETAYNNKIRDLAELDHLMSEQKLKFHQSLNQCISQTSKWINTFVLKAPVSGRLTFAGIIEKNQNVLESQELFIIKSGDSEFFGEIFIPQYNMGKVEIGQKVIVKLYSYPFEQYGVIKGKLAYISEVAFRDSLFIAKVRFEHLEEKNKSRKITIKNGMKGDAEIITRSSSLLQRLVRNLKKINSPD